MLGLGLLATATCAPLPRTGAAQQVAPPVSHVVLILMENKEYDAIIGSPDAPYLNQLAAQFALADAYYGVRHPSLPNYLALLGGDTFGIHSDCTRCLVDAPNLVDALEAAGKTWKSYQEDLPTPCFLGASAGRYVLKHNPFLYFRDIREDPGRCQQVVPLAQFADDLQAGTLPDFAWISPNLRHDMHDGTVADGDRWLASIVPSILASDAWRRNGLLLIVWDEGKTNAGCCGTPGGGLVPLLIIAPGGHHGNQVSEPANHYTLLRLIEDLWGLQQLGHAADIDAKPLLGSLQNE